MKQPAPIDGGIYAHQIRVHPSNKMVVMVTRGNGPAPGRPEDPGALKIYSYKDGIVPIASRSRRTAESDISRGMSISIRRSHTCT